MKYKKKESKLEKDFKRVLAIKGFLCYSIEGKAGEKDGSPDVLAIDTDGRNYLFELKTGSALRLGQVLALRKSKDAYLVEYNENIASSELFTLTFFNHDGTHSEWTLDEIMGIYSQTVHI